MAALACAALTAVSANAMTAVGVASWQATSQSLADNNQDNHGISSQKFHLLREFLMLGYRVFLSGAGGRCSCGKL